MATLEKLADVEAQRNRWYLTIGEIRCAPPGEARDALERQGDAAALALRDARAELCGALTSDLARAGVAVGPQLGLKSA